MDSKAMDGVAAAESGGGGGVWFSDGTRKRKRLTGGAASSARERGALGSAVLLGRPKSGHVAKRRNEEREPGHVAIGLRRGRGAGLRAGRRGARLEQSVG